MALPQRYNGFLDGADQPQAMPAAAIRAVNGLRQNADAILQFQFQSRMLPSTSRISRINHGLGLLDSAEESRYKQSELMRASNEVQMWRHGGRYKAYLDNSTEMLSQVGWDGGRLNDNYTSMIRSSRNMREFAFAAGYIETDVEMKFARSGII